MTAAVDPWRFHLHPEVWVLMAAIIVGYWYLVRRGPARPPGHMGPGSAGPVSKKQVAQFSLGWLILWIGADYPIHDIGEKYLFSVHMFQHLLFSLIAPGLLFLGIPDWLQKQLWGSGWRLAALKRLGMPLVAGGLYTVWLVVSHWPKLVDAALGSEPLHFFMHLMLFSTAALMWFPVLNRNPDLPMMSPPARMVYVFLQSIVPTVPASFFTFADGVIYKTYARAPRPFKNFTAIADQQLAAGIMKVWGGLVLWAIIAAIFFRWTAEDERARKARRRVLTWDEVQAELDRTEAPPVG